MGAPKALLRFQGETFLERILSTIKTSGIDAVRVVVGRHRSELENALPGLPFVYNPNYEQGMSTSVQAGIRSLPEQTEAAVLFLVDHPLVRPKTVEKLIDEFCPGSIIVPVFGGRRGHPVLFPREALEEILDLKPGQGANTVLHRDPGRVVEVPVDDPGIVRDVDTPEDFEALLRENWLS